MENIMPEEVYAQGKFVTGEIKNTKNIFNWWNSHRQQMF